MSFEHVISPSENLSERIYGSRVTLYVQWILYTRGDCVADEKPEPSFDVSEGDVRPEDVIRKLKVDYSYPMSDRTSKVFEVLGGLFSKLQSPPVDIHAVMQEAASLISKQFAVKTVGIGLKSTTDGLFRYQVMLGYTPESEAATRKLVYNESQFSGTVDYKGSLISKNTMIFLAEDNPYLEGEQASYNRPFLLGGKRRAIDDSVEGDYIDVRIMANNKLVGWIEISGTILGKLPDVVTIRWLELIAQMIGTAIAHEGLPK